MLVCKRNKCRKFLCIFLSVFVVLLSDFSLAFTLGDIRLDSAQNEPLDAEIELLELDGLDESQIIVTLGSEADFDRVGVEPLPLLNELEFDIDVLSSSDGLIRITSSEAIVEPYLNFVLNVRWPSGRVIRKYTVLLDLPTFTANPAPASAPTPARSTPTAPAPTAPAPRVVPEPVEERAEVSEPAAEQTVMAEPDVETVVIQNGDSLWNIALATRPGNDVSVQQMMLAIQRANANSDAFIRNNINGIRAGRVLRIPSQQEINAITQEQAVTQVALQNQQFSNNAQPLAVNNSQNGAPATRDQLSIVNNTAEEDQSTEIADLNATIANLENELALSEENLDRALLENAELNSRLNDLEEEIAILENIIAIEGQRMAELQDELKAQAEAADVLAVSSVPDTAPPTPETTPAPQAPAPEPAQPTGIMAQISALLGSSIGMIGALVVLLALVVGFLIARNRSAADEENDEFDTILAEEENKAELDLATSDQQVKVRGDDQKAEGGDTFAESYDEPRAETLEEITEVADITSDADNSLENLDQDIGFDLDSDGDSDEEIVLDLDDVDEIEFLDAGNEAVDLGESDIGDDTDNQEQGDESVSSLGNLGLDDEIAFDESDEEELEIITDQDEVATKLDLACPYSALHRISGYSF